MCEREKEGVGGYKSALDSLPLSSPECPTKTGINFFKNTAYILTEEEYIRKKKKILSLRIMQTLVKCVCGVKQNLIA